MDLFEQFSPVLRLKYPATMRKFCSSTFFYTDDEKFNTQFRLPHQINLCIHFSVLLKIDMTTSLVRRDLSVHAGKNLSIPCVRNYDVMWSREGSNITYNVNVSRM